MDWLPVRHVPPALRVIYAGPGCSPTMTLKIKNKRQWSKLEKLIKILMIHPHICHWCQNEAVAVVEHVCHDYLCTCLLCCMHVYTVNFPLVISVDLSVTIIWNWLTECWLEGCFPLAENWWYFCGGCWKLYKVLNEAWWVRKHWHIVDFLQSQRSITGLRWEIWRHRYYINNVFCHWQHCCEPNNNEKWL